jgi:PleD family two-component response regulator
VGATLARAEDSIMSLIARADRLMYRSKESGRNRVTTDQEGTEIPD